MRAPKREKTAVRTASMIGRRLEVVEEGKDVRNAKDGKEKRETWKDRERETATVFALIMSRSDTRFHISSSGVCSEIERCTC